MVSHEFLSHAEYTYGNLFVGMDDTNMSLIDRPSEPAKSLYEDFHDPYERLA